MGVSKSFSGDCIKIVVSNPIFSPEEYRKRLVVLVNFNIFENMSSYINEFISRIVDMERQKMQVRILAETNRSENCGKNRRDLGTDRI